MANYWNSTATAYSDFGRFNFSKEDKILRWLLREDTIYDAFISSDAEVVECENKNMLHGVFRSDKTILKNPRKLNPDLVMNLCLKLDLPDNTYFQYLTF